MPDDIVDRLERAAVGAGGAWSLLLGEARDEIERLRRLYDEAYDACRYALANSPRWQENAATVVADYEYQEARRG